MRRRQILHGAVSVAALATGVAWAGASSARVFAAASLARALDRAASLWSSTGGAARISISYGASSTLARQIELGAPADLFVSANLAWMDRAVERGAVLGETRAPLLANRLILAAPPGRPPPFPALSEIGPDADLVGALGEDGRLAIGRVKTVPLGVYGRAALTHLGLWETVAQRLAEVENARLAAALVTRGETPLGVLYASDASGRDGPRRLGLFPEASHPPIVYPAALTPEGARNAAARDLLAFLRSEAAAEIFREEGFSAPARRR